MSKNTGPEGGPEAAQKPGLLASLQSYVADRSRRSRAGLFFQTLVPQDDARALDLGGGRGIHAARHYGRLNNVWIGDHNQKSLERAHRDFGYRTIWLDGTTTLPLDDNAFDIIFCSSVIEHVTGPRPEALALFKTDGGRFAAEAFRHQKRFADEIRRCAPQYFVQTPYRYFPVEVHCWIPLVGLLPTHWQWRVIHFFNKFWSRKQMSPDWALLNERQMRELFPDGEIHREEFLIFTKSLIAIRRGRSGPVATTEYSRNASAGP